MILPKLYEIKTQSQKNEIIVNIVRYLEGVSKQHYPNIISQFENDNAKVNLIERIICNSYSTIGGSSSMEDIIDSIEVFL